MEAQRINTVAETLCIPNIVGNFQLTQSVNLEALCDELGGKYDPDHFPALMWRDAKTQTTMEIFENGKMNVTGGDSENELLFSPLSIVMRLRRNGMYPNIDVHVIEFPNYVVSCKLGYRLDMNKVKKEADVSPQFKGPRMKLMLCGRQIHVICFDTGHLNVTSVRSRAHLPELVRVVSTHFERFRLR